VQNTSRTLVLVRHAQAETFAIRDEDRLLTPGGRADAAAAGEWLAAQGVRPDRALVSAAQRTQETWAALAGAAGFPIAPDLDHGLYAAGPESALDLIRMVEDDVDTVLVLGHNPTMSFIAHMLDNSEGDPAAIAAMAVGFPTCSVAVFTIDSTWEGLEVSSARLVAFHVARA
jgi:phosphohistidine phosphatase